MDWSKAKTILIIAFVAVNIFILCVIVNGKPVDEPTVSDEFISNTTKLLKDKNITIDTEIPRYIPSLTSIIVEFENANPKKLNENYFNGEGIVKSEEGVKEIYNSGQSILIINDRLIIYEK